jgi:hypothetical protein
VVEVGREDATIPGWLGVYILDVEIAEKMPPSLYGYMSILWWLRKAEKMQPSLDCYVSFWWLK